MRFRDVNIRHEARADLFEIYDYLASRRSRDFAFGYIGRIEKVCESLIEFPHRGVPRTDLGAALRSLNFEGRAVIVYHLVGETVEIVRILHAGRNVSADLFDQ